MQDVERRRERKTEKQQREHQGQRRRSCTMALLLVEDLCWSRYSWQGLQSRRAPGGTDGKCEEEGGREKLPRTDCKLPLLLVPLIASPKGWSVTCGDNSGAEERSLEQRSGKGRSKGVFPKCVNVSFFSVCFLMPGSVINSICINQQ